MIEFERKPGWNDCIYAAFEQAGIEIPVFGYPFPSRKLRDLERILQNEGHAVTYYGPGPGAVLDGDTPIIAIVDALQDGSKVHHAIYYPAVRDCPHLGNLSGLSVLERKQ